MATTLAPVHLNRKVEEFLTQKRKMLIGGQWVEAASGKTFDTFNPATGEVLTCVPEGDREDIDRAARRRAKLLKKVPGPRFLQPNEGACF
jgi:hypothetical protein